MTQSLPLRYCRDCNLPFPEAGPACPECGSERITSHSSDYAIEIHIARVIEEETHELEVLEAMAYRKRDRVESFKKMLERLSEPNAVPNTKETA